jgi:hypothetical protein
MAPLPLHSVADMSYIDKGQGDPMRDEDRKKIEELIGEMHCPKDFKCVESGFELLCEAKDVGLDHHLVCLEPTAFQCRFSLMVERDYYCGCPLRIYIAKHLGK